MGDGLGVEPDDGAIVSPVDATITVVAGTGHAIGFKSESGLEVLLHLGVDTVELEGAPFRLSVAVGGTADGRERHGSRQLVRRSVGRLGCGRVGVRPGRGGSEGSGPGTAGAG